MIAYSPANESFEATDRWIQRVSSENKALCRVSPKNWKISVIRFTETTTDGFPTLEDISGCQFIGLIRAFFWVSFLVVIMNSSDPGDQTLVPGSGIGLEQ
ncbi:hypothetical protein CRM22_001763, partial [Opisthorchis felineus]